MVILRAHVNAHVPCRREIDLEAVQLRDQLLTHRRVNDRMAGSAWTRASWFPVGADGRQGLVDLLAPSTTGSPKVSIRPI
jgi:hypothetical protein